MFLALSIKSFKIGPIFDLIVSRLEMYSRKEQKQNRNTPKDLYTRIPNADYS